MIRGFPGNLGDLAVSIAMPAGDPAYQLQVDPRPTSEADGDERGTKRWSAAHNAVGLAGESPVVGIDCLPT